MKSLSELAGPARTIDVDGVAVTYRPGAVTFELIEPFEGENVGGSAVLGFLEAVVESWEIADDDGSQLGTTAADIRKVPAGFLNAISQRIIEEAQPDADEGKASAAGSQPEGASETSRAGTSSSELPATSAFPLGNSPDSPSSGSSGAP